VTGLLARALVALAVALTSLACTIIAAGFLSGALYLWLRSLSLAPALAALLVGVVLLGIAGLGTVAAVQVAGGTDRVARAGADGAVGGSSLVAEFGARAAREAVAATDAHPVGAASLAFLAGLSVGASADLHEMLKAALRTR
jgi:hypothetical protein